MPRKKRWESLCILRGMLRLQRLLDFLQGGLHRGQFCHQRLLNFQNRLIAHSFQRGASTVVVVVSVVVSRGRGHMWRLAAAPPWIPNRENGGPEHPIGFRLGPIAGRARNPLPQGWRLFALRHRPWSVATRRAIQPQVGPIVREFPLLFGCSHSALILRNPPKGPQSIKQQCLSLVYYYFASSIIFSFRIVCPSGRWNGVVTRFAPRMAACDALGCQPSSPPRTEALDCFTCISRTSGLEAAIGPQQGTQYPLVQSNEDQHQCAHHGRNLRR